MGQTNNAAISYHGDLPSVILQAIRTVAEARGFKNFADSAELNRENQWRVEFASMRT